AIGQTNKCRYCLSAHTLLARQAGLSVEDIKAAREGHAKNPLDNALLQLANAIVEQRGVILDQQLANARNAGVDDELVLEVLGQVVVNTLTNYGNHLAATDIDFPAVSLHP
ncbi:MAG: carboxymuconolactone decarboxylase family protein, partial [Enterovibrio sp.]